MKNTIITTVFASLIFLSCSKDDAEETLSDLLEEEITLTVFTDVEFAQDNDDTDYGRFFSTTDETIYKTSEVDETTGPKIDLVYQGSTSTFIFFESPDDLFDSNFEIPGATSTKVTNFESGFSVADFDAMTDSEPLKNLTVTHDQNSIGSLDFPLIVLFENAAGKKGAIKLKAINSDRLLVDIKVEK